jgi:nitrilase
MVVDPWGKVIAERAAEPGVVMADIDPVFQAKMRLSLPALGHRRL